jgi:predicted porin
LFCHWAGAHNTLDCSGKGGRKDISREILTVISSEEKSQMTKKLLALAVAGAFAAPFTAAADSVTIYGTLNMSLDFTEAKGATNPLAAPPLPPGSPGVTYQGVDATSTEQISCSSCNIGFRGEEDLGGGLKAWFQLESGINPDEGAGDWTSRNSAVGLRGGWGTFLIGKWDTPHKLNNNATTPFYATTTAAYNAILGADGGIGVGANPGTPFDNRQNNSIQYWSPSFAGGLMVRLLYSTGRDSAAAADNNGDAGTPGEDYVYGASVAWNAKNLYAGISYEKQGDVGNIVVAPGVFTGLDREAYTVNVSYAFMGKYRVGLIWENLSIDRPSVLVPTSAVDVDRDAYGIYAMLPLGPGAVHAWYIQADDWSNVNDSGADFWALGYYYNLSKRTVVYAQYASMDNDTNSRYRLGAGPGNRLTPSTGADPEAFSLGVRHTF